MFKALSAKTCRLPRLLTTLLTNVMIQFDRIYINDFWWHYLPPGIFRNSGALRKVATFQNDLGTFRATHQTLWCCNKCSLDLLNLKKSYLVYSKILIPSWMWQLPKLSLESSINQVDIYGEGLANDTVRTNFKIFVWAKYNEQVGGWFWESEKNDYVVYGQPLTFLEIYQTLRLCKTNYFKGISKNA